MKPLAFDFKRVSKMHGGAFVGIIFHYPISMVNDEFTYEFQQVKLSIGFLFWQLGIRYAYRIQKTVS